MSRAVQNFAKPSLTAVNSIHNGGWKHFDKKGKDALKTYLEHQDANAAAFPCDLPTAVSDLNIYSTSKTLSHTENVIEFNKPASAGEVRPDHLLYGKFSDFETLYEVEHFTVDERLIALTGPYLTLSNYYVTPIFVKSKRYRSVEHYVYEKYFKYLKLSPKRIEKILTTTDPAKLPFIALKFIPGQRFANLDEREKEKLLKWYDRAMRRKLSSYENLRQTLLSTGNALIIETNNCEIDHLMTIGTNEINVLSLLGRFEISTENVLQACLRKSDELQVVENAKSLQSLTRLGQNQTGLILMRLRKILQQQQVARLGRILAAPALFSRPHPASMCPVVDSGSIICFTDCSMFHPTYLCPFWMSEDPFVLYLTVNHYVYVEAAKFFCFPQCSIENLLQQSPGDVQRTFFDELKHRFPDPIKYREWYDHIFEESLIAGYRAEFNLHPSLLSRLLDTKDALLVYCRRHSTATGELAISMRESELREWLRQSGVKPVHLIGLLSQDFAQRIPYLGSNRLGFVLMAVRRELRLKASPVTISPVASVTNNEIIFGETNALEELDDGDVHHDGPKPCFWPNPFLMMNKLRGTRIWYPRKRRLPGFYANYQAVEEKRQKWKHTHVLHPDYESPSCPSTGYPIDPKIIEFNKNHQHVLCQMVGDLVNRANVESDRLQSLENEIDCLLDEITDRNLTEYIVSQVIKGGGEKVAYENFDFSPNKMASSSLPIGLAPEAQTDQSTSSSQKTNSGPKMSAMRSGFEFYLKRCLSVANLENNHSKAPKFNLNDEIDDNAKSDAVSDKNSNLSLADFRSVFDSSVLKDESRARFLIDNLYKHLSDEDRSMALDWLKHAISRLHEFKDYDNGVDSASAGEFWQNDSTDGADFSTFVPHLNKSVVFRQSVVTSTADLIDD